MAWISDTVSWAVQVELGRKSMKPAVARGFTREGRRIVFNRGRDLIAVVPFFPPFFEKDSSFSSFLSRLEIG